MANASTQQKVTVGSVWESNDERNTDRGKTGRAKPKPLQVVIVTLPTTSTAGIMQTVSSGASASEVGSTREFTYESLMRNYIKVG